MSPPTPGPLISCHFSPPATYSKQEPVCSQISWSVLSARPSAACDTGDHTWFPDAGGLPTLHPSPPGLAWGFPGPPLFLPGQSPQILWLEIPPTGWPLPSTPSSVFPPRSKLVYPAAYLTSLLGELIFLSKAAFPELNSSPNLLRLSSGQCHPSFAQGKTWSHLDSSFFHTSH